MSFDPAKGYAGNGPGQKVDTILDRLTLKDIQLIVGPRVLPLLPVATQKDRQALSRAALRKLKDQPRQAFEASDLRKTLLRNLDPGKLDELKHRLVAGGIASKIDAVDFDRIFSAAAWPIVSGFFGLEPDEVAAAVRPLATQPVPVQFGLFPHQRSVVRRTYARIGSGLGRTLIHMPTGAGKTRTAMHYAARILNEGEPCVVVWLASSRELLDQAAESFEIAWNHLGNREVRIHRFWGDYDSPPDELSDGILIAGLAKMHAWRGREGIEFMRLGKRTKLVVIDEAHQAIAPTYRDVIDGIAEAGQANALLGLTATPGRTWNDVTADEKLSEFFGGSKVVLEIDGYDNPVDYLLANGYLARPTFTRIAYPDSSTPSDKEVRALARLDDYSDAMLESFAENTARNLAIIENVSTLIVRGHTRIILFAASVQHAEDLAAALSAYDVESYVVSGNTPSGRRNAVLKRFKSNVSHPVVMCNFGVLTTGFDAPKTSAAIIARPTKSLVLFSQMVGRATRGVAAGGNEKCEILTVHDPSYPGFGDVAEAFFNWEDVWNEH